MIKHHHYYFSFFKPVRRVYYVEAPDGNAPIEGEGAKESARDVVDAAPQQLSLAEQFYVGKLAALSNAIDANRTAHPELAAAAEARMPALQNYQSEEGMGDKLTELYALLDSFEASPKRQEAMKYVETAIASAKEALGNNTSQEASQQRAFLEDLRVDTLDTLSHLQLNVPSLLEDDAITKIITNFDVALTMNVGKPANVSEQPIQNPS